ncbi:unnamed protein product [Closterium sp. NIES-53]
MQQLWDRTHKRLQDIRSSQKRFADHHRRDHTIAVGDHVLLDTCNLNLGHLPSKLQPRFCGPFLVEEQVTPVTFRLRLPASWKIHNTFHVQLLKPYQDPNKLYTGRQPPPPPPVLVNDELEYEVESVLAHRRRRHGALEFLVRWKGYDPSQDSWCNILEWKFDPVTLRTYEEAITGPYSSRWQTAMDAEMVSWKSAGTYADEVPPPGANIVDGMWIFRGVDFFQTFSPTQKMTTLRVLLHVAAQRDYGLHSLDFSTAFFLRRPDYGLRQAPRELHDTLRTTLAALCFAPSAADPSLFLRTDTSLPPFYIPVYVDNLVFATAETEALALVKAELQERHSCTDVGHSLSTPPSDESVHPSGPYPELVGCLMYLMTCTRPDLAYPLSLLARYVAPGRHRKAEIYVGAMGAQELRWLTYLLTDLGERPRSPPVLYVDNKVMIALCDDQRLEHRTKHIALCYFLTQELQQCGQLRLAYVATQANTSDVFTKALGSGDHQRFCTALGLVPTLPHLLVS